MSVFATLTAADALGMSGDVPDHAHKPAMPGIARSAGPAPQDHPAPWSPDNPLFWFGALAALTFGLVAFSTSLRIGPGQASISLGKP